LTSRHQTTQKHESRPFFDIEINSIDSRSIEELPVMNRTVLCSFLLFLYGLPVSSFAESPPVLGLPIDCKLGVDCIIQNYVDRDPSPMSHDFMCGTRTYDAHNGTDFRIPDEGARAKGVSVLAAASGVVDRLRDGEPDISVRVTGQQAVENKECGNAVVINHDDGWSTQYCHMARGSIVVKQGQRVTAGEKIGLVGLSGNTEYPHVHLSVRHRGELIDPFSFGSTAACGSEGRSLWQDTLKPDLKYREIEVLNKGFSSAPVTMENIESGEILSHPLTSEGPIIAYVRVVGLKSGDLQSLTITSPDGTEFAGRTFPPSDANKAQAYISVGRNNPKREWPIGNFKAHYLIKRAGTEVLQIDFEAKP
jgi:murein DD-endopeptidase MepM/ murein hydrolase activator NlpD